ncbi:MAG: AAA family ATPase [Chloroflexi bacterium]|nr:AAA family ATPase [Chloroflexota bacterium]
MVRGRRRPWSDVVKEYNDKDSRGCGPMETQATNLSLHMARTKFQVPVLPPDVLARQRLFDAVRLALSSRRLVLLSAPAGYGKTTLLAALPQACPDLPMAWLSLDEEDNDPIHFLAALVASLQCLEPTCGITAQAVLGESLSSSSRPDSGDQVRRAVGALINDILATMPGPFALLLDDLHHITQPAVHVALDYLLERLPPQMRVVMSTRHDPPLGLARLRARGQLAEFRLGDLRFTPDEVAWWLQERLRLRLSPEELAALESLAEGWAAGLRLLALSLEHFPTSAARAGFLAQMASRDRSVFDFLAEEVLGHQSDAVKAFLLETSILPEPTPALCRAVTGRPDAEALLEEVGRRNLLIQSPAERGDRYRYHPLFAEFLRRRLAQATPERVAELHRRAAEAETVAARAIHHYLAAGLWEQAAVAVEHVGEELARDGLFHMLRGWIEALPASIRDARPRLSYFLGVCALQRGALAEASSYLECARSGFEAAGDEAGRGEALQELVGVASQQHDYQGQAELIRLALACPLSTHGRVQLLMARAWQAVYERNLDEADAYLNEAIDLTLDSRELRAFAIVAPILRAHLTLLPGGTERLVRYCRQALARFGEGVGVVQAGAHCLLGYIYALRGHIDEAVREAERARVISRRLGGFHFLDWEVDIVLTTAHLMRGDYASSERLWAARLPWYEQTPAIRPWTATFLYCLGRAQWMQGNLEQARKTQARMSSLVDAQYFPELAISRALMRVLLEIAERRYAEAERILRPAVELEQANPHCLVFGNARLLLAYLYLSWNRPQQAMSELAPMLARCQGDGMPGLILREGAAIVAPLLRLAAERGVHAAYAAHLLSLLGVKAEARRVDVPETGETLTPREIEVLRLVAAGASNKAITEQLVITESTAKTHVTSILRKLNVTSRTQAAARARELQIV